MNVDDLPYGEVPCLGVFAVPQGSLVVIADDDWDDEASETTVATIRYACGHDRFALLVLSSDARIGMFGADEIVEALRAATREGRL